MHAAQTDSKRANSAQSARLQSLMNWVFVMCGYVCSSLMIGTFALVLAGLLIPECSAVELPDIEFKGNFRSHRANGRIPMQSPAFRAPSSLPNEKVVDADSEPDPFTFQPAAWQMKAKYVSAKEKQGEEITWSSKPLAALRTNIALPSGELPDQDLHADPSFGPECCDCCCNRGWPGLCYCFAATGLYYNPLYFEEVNLERYGYGCTPCLQSAASAAHFFGRVPMLPYMMATDCPNDCNYALGHYRPGSCAPWRHHCLPITKRGSLAQTGAIVGLVFLLP